MIFFIYLIFYNFFNKKINLLQRDYQSKSLLQQSSVA